MSRTRFVNELAILHDKLGEMAMLAKDAIEVAVESLEDLDLQKAHQVFALDRQMFDLQIEVENRCLDLIALQTPVARDLRRVETAVKALVTEDLALAKGLYDDDEAADSLYDEIYREVVTHMMDGSLRVVTGANYILVARYLERIADHS